MIQNASELSVTLSPELFAQIRDEAKQLDLPIEWLIASLIVDTVDSVSPATAPVAA
jgi:hypothetical protein